eukprot:g1044.t1
MWWARERVKLPGQDNAPATQQETLASEEIVKLAVEFGDLETACSYLSSRLTQMNVMCENLKSKNDDLKRCRDVSEKLQALIKRFEKQHQELVAERRKSAEVERLRTRNARLELDLERMGKENDEMRGKVVEAIAVMERRAAIETPMVKARATTWQAETLAKLEEYRLKGNRLAEVCAQQQNFIEENFLKLLLQSDNGDPESMAEGGVMFQYEAWKESINAGRITFDNSELPELSLFGDPKPPPLSHHSAASKRPEDYEGPKKPDDLVPGVDYADADHAAAEADQSGGGAASNPMNTTSSSFGLSSSSATRAAAAQQPENEIQQRMSATTDGAMGGGEMDDGGEGAGMATTYGEMESAEEEDGKRSVGTQYPPPALELSLFSAGNKEALADRQKGALEELYVTR